VCSAFRPRSVDIRVGADARRSRGSRGTQAMGQGWKPVCHCSPKLLGISLEKIQYRQGDTDLGMA